MSGTAAIGAPYLTAASIKNDRTVIKRVRFGGTRSSTEESAMTQPASSTVPDERWRSPLLGEPRTLEVVGGRIEAFERGQGPALVFAHGWLANANLWREVVEALAARFRCVVLDLPLGSHRLAMDPDADLTPDGCGALIAASLAALDLRDVTLVGNDSGGAYSQIAAAAHPERIARLVLNSCETPYDPFPPPPFDGLPALAADRAKLGQALGALRDPEVRASEAAYGLLTKHPVEARASDSYALPASGDPAVLRDISKVMASAASAPVHAAGRELIDSFKRPVLFAWGPEDRVFPIAHAERYAAALTDGRLARIDDAYSFTPEDQPLRLATEIAAFCAD
jgi:pimeloyl-ACP methyl ester carboxylesterase